MMTADIRYVFDDEDMEHVAENMAQQQLRRLPVMNRKKRLVGVVSPATWQKDVSHLWSAVH